MIKYGEMFDIEAAKFSDLFSPLVSGFQCYCKVVPHCKSILCRVNIFFPLGVSAYFGWMCSWVEKCKVKVNFMRDMIYLLSDLSIKIYEVWFSSHITTSYCLHLFLSTHILSKIYIVCNWFAGLPADILLQGPLYYPFHSYKLSRVTHE